MKTTKLIILFASAAIVSALQSCKPEKKILEPAPSQTEGLTQASWVLYKVDQIDVNKQLAFVESDTLLDVSDVYIDGTPMEVSFSATGDFTINPGSGSLLFPKQSGKWEFNNVDYPNAIIFEKGLPEESTVSLLKPVRPRDPNLILKFNKLCGGKRTVSYHLWFMRK
jgi:hypothetical protein